LDSIEARLEDLRKKSQQQIKVIDKHNNRLARVKNG